MGRKKSLIEKYPPSDPCTCEICTSYCSRPGWWTVKEAASAIKAGYAARMMLEISPERTFGVLSPAFKGCESGFATNYGATKGCTFFIGRLCELFGSGHQPLECRFCHHERRNLGPRCHADLEKDWNTPAGKALIEEWGKLTGFQDHLAFLQNARSAGNKIG